MRVSARYTENYRNDAMAAYPSHRRALGQDVRSEVRSCPRGHGRGHRRDPAGDPPGSPRRFFPGPGQHPSASPRDDRGHRPDERLHAGPSGPELQAPIRACAGDAEAHTALRGVGVLDGDGGDPPPRRDGLPGWDQVVGSTGGLPHRGARSDEGPEGEERRHRARRIQGRIRPQAAVGRAGSS